MNKNGTIIIVEDDLEDQEVLVEIFGKLNYPNKVPLPITAPVHSGGHYGYKF